LTKPQYKLFNENIAETIRNEISRLRDALLFGSKGKVHKFGKVDITCDIATLEILLSDYILDYSEANSTVSDRQLETRREWHDYLTKTESLSYNECLLILLGVSPTLADLLEPKLYETTLRNEVNLHEKHLTLLFFPRKENHLLREKFGAEKIDTKKFIDWALKSSLLSQNTK
jgi:hypothetical protein